MSSVKSKSEGFTFIEILIATTILIALIVLAVPVTNDFRESQTLIAERDSVVGLLRRARTLALANGNESDHGIMIASTSTTLFQGSSYAGRAVAYDEIFQHSGGIVITGATEIVFSALSSEATSTQATTTIMLKLGNRSQKVEFNTAGAIFW